MQNPGNSTEKFDTENIGLLDYGINLHKNVEKKYLSNFFHGKTRRGFLKIAPIMFADYYRCCWCNLYMTHAFLLINIRMYLYFLGI